MKKIPHIVGLITIITAAGFIGFSIWKSTWLIWYALPPQGENRVVLDGELFHGQIGDLAGVVGQAFSLNPLTAYQSSIQQYGFSQIGNDIYVVIRPKVGQKQQLVEKLNTDGWAITHEKLFIIAQKTNHNAVFTDNYPLSRIVHMITGTFYASFIKTHAVYPLVLAEISKTTPTTIQKSLAFIIRYSNNQILIDGLNGPGSILGIKTNRKALSTPNDAPETLSVTIPSDSITSLPPSIAYSINSLILQGLSFSHTKPNLISTIQKSDSLKVDIRVSGVDVVVYAPQKTVKEQLMRLIQTDDQYNYPKKHGFYLPDKTLAYEYIPGNTPSNWQTYNGNCQLYKGKDRIIYICDSDNNLLITTNKEKTDDQIEKIEKGKWLIIDKSKQLDIHASGDSKNFSGSIKKQATNK